MFECFEFENGGKRNGRAALHQVHGRTWRAGPVAGAPHDMSSQLY